MRRNPLTQDPASHAEDARLIELVKSGDLDALETLISNHQDWVYNIVLRMVYLPEDAEDVTQEVLLKVLTKLSTFEGRSTFRTWLYRIVVNHVLNMKRSRAEDAEWTFAKYAAALDGAIDQELPDPNAVPVDLQLLVDESRLTCSTGMLLCLDRAQRLVYILGDIFEVPDAIGAELLEITKVNFRQKLSRARRDLHSFMQQRCGLVNTANPCRCAKKTQSFMNAGYVNAQNLLFANERLQRVRDVSPGVRDTIDTLDAAYAGLYREHPFHRSPDFVAAIRTLISQPRYRSIFGES